LIILFFSTIILITNKILNNLRKIFSLLPVQRRKQALILMFFLFIGLVLEMCGLGLLIPGLTLLLKSNIGQEYPSFVSFLNIVGNPSQKELVTWSMLFLVVFYFMKEAFLAMVVWKQSQFTMKFSAELGEKLFRGYLHQPFIFHVQKNTAELLRNIQVEVHQFTAVTQAIISLLMESSLIIGVIAILIIVEPFGSLTVILFLAITSLIFTSLTKKRLLNWGQQRKDNSHLLNKHILQGLSGVKDIKLSGKEEYFFEEFRKQNLIFTNINIRVNTLSQVPRLYLEFLAVFGLATFVMVMTMQSRPLETMLPILGVFLASAFKMIPSVNKIMASGQVIRMGISVVDGLHAEFKLISDIACEGQGELNFSKEIMLKNVVYQYPETTQEALRNISIRIAKGSTVGLIGPSGSGKSTLVDVLLGLFDPISGEVYSDKIAIKINIRDWQSKIGYVPQTIYLTDDTLRNNIAFGISKKDTDDEAIKRVIQSAHLEEFVKSLPMGLDTNVGERGVKLSGGQRQRVGIARALYNDPPILVLDEATSALDYDTENAVMEAIKSLHGIKTIIIVAHRLSTIEHCDYLYRLEKGVIIEEGVPDKILTNSIL
jgi:ABC-type multidrug transport system fused ATPase/permease subunit